MLKQTLQHKQIQSIKLNPQLQQAIGLLTVSHQELESHLEQAITDNPLLSFDQPDQSLPPSETLKDLNPFDTLRAPEYDNLWTNDDGYKRSHRLQNTDTSAVDLLTAQMSLREHLIMQTNVHFSESQERRIVYDLIENLDASGHLRLPIDALANQLHCSTNDLQDILKRLQRFDPIGVFARDPWQCIALQLKDKGLFSDHAKKFFIHIELFAAGKMQQLMKKCNCTQDDLTQLLSHIRACDPKPGARFQTHNNPIVIPDVYVMWDQAQEKWRVRGNDQNSPKLKIDFEMCQRVFKDETAKKYINFHLSSANMLIKALKKRHASILKVANAIIDHQDMFMTKGPEFLKPLTLKTIAQDVQLHESTVSRCIQNKFMATPRGTFAFNFFLTHAVANLYKDQASHSCAFVQQRLSKIVAQEPHLSPYSDDQLVHQMALQGIDIARRTVSKYREDLGIASSYVRRRRYDQGFIKN